MATKPHIISVTPPPATEQASAARPDLKLIAPDQPLASATDQEFLGYVETAAKYTETVDPSLRAQWTAYATDLANQRDNARREKGWLPMSSKTRDTLIQQILCLQANMHKRARCPS